jgi:hypothetical protein
MILVWTAIGVVLWVRYRLRKPARQAATPSP